MTTLFYTVGLPAAGKSTWAKDYQSKFPNGAVKRVNKDDLRDMIDGGRWSAENEKMVLKIRDTIICNTLGQGKHVIVDDTNLDPKHRARFNEIAKEMRAGGREVEVKEVPFTHVTPEECIERDLKRLRSVGKDVIMSMYNKYLRPQPEVIKHDPALPNCILIDLDGTIAINNGHRSFYDYTKCFDDDVNTPVVYAIKAVLDFQQYHGDKKTVPIFLSGREGTYESRQQTKNFIIDIKKCDFLLEEPILHMRTAGDMRDDTIVKRELFDAHIRGKYNVLHVWDDRAKVCRMWRDLGLTVFQVAEGNF